MPSGPTEATPSPSEEYAVHLRLASHYWADAGYTVALTLDAPDASSTLNDVTAALQRPVRPLFIGCKPCPPATPLVTGRVSANTWTGVLRAAPLPDWADDHADYRAWWPDAMDDPQARPTTDRRDWANQIHVGERWIVQDVATVREPQ